MTFPASRIALIHATALAVAPVQAAFARHWHEARCMNLLDDSLSVDQAEAGTLTPAMVRRFVDLALYARGTGCSAILFTCSAFGPAIEAAGQACGLPTLKPNEAMFDAALLDGAQGGRRRMGLVATFAASLPPMSAELRAMAAARGIPMELRTAYVSDAMNDLAQGRPEQHHQKVAEAARGLGDCDAILLAQFSMAAAHPRVQAAVSGPVLSSPDCAVLAMRKRMNGGIHA